MKRGSLAQQMMKGRMSVKSPTSTVENNYAPLGKDWSFLSCFIERI